MSIVPKNRQEVLETIVNTPGHVLLHGDRGIGKTTFATEILPEHLDKSRLIYVNLLGYSFIDLLEWLVVELSELFSLEIKDVNNQIKHTIKEYGPVTFVFDEWETLLSDHGIKSVLKDLAQMPKVKMILIGKYLLSDFPETMNFSSLFTSIPLSLFTCEETVEIIAQSKVTLTEDAKKKLHEITTGHGFFLNSFLVSLYCEYADQLITENEVMALTDTVKKSVRWKD